MLEYYMNLFTPLTLPNGNIIPNRLAKAAMEENIADLDFTPSQTLINIYQHWAEGDVGLIITGNVMIDATAVTGPAGVVLENDRHLDKFKQWAKISRSHGAQVWMQINHPGRQMQANLGQPTYAPSAIALNMGKLSKMFVMPREMTPQMIKEVIQRFATTASLAEQAGFTGVEIHAAHGYLLSQFLSPLSNQRQDEWGGSLENRARILIEVVKAVRAKVSNAFAVAVKLNSADFQRGGFSADDAKAVVQMLNDLPVDLVEISGGSYEAPAMQGEARDGRTLAREAYFLEFAEQIQAIAKMPIMVTGGIRRKVIAEQVLQSGVAMVGMGTALAIQPDLPNRWKNDTTSLQTDAPALKPITWKNKSLGSLANMAMVRYQLRQLSQNKPTNSQVSPALALGLQQLATTYRTYTYKKQLQ